MHQKRFLLGTPVCRARNIESHSDVNRPNQVFRGGANWQYQTLIRQIWAQSLNHKFRGAFRATLWRYAGGF